MRSMPPDCLLSAHYLRQLFLYLISYSKVLTGPDWAVTPFISRNRHLGCWPEILGGSSCHGLQHHNLLALHRLLFSSFDFLSRFIQMTIYVLLGSCKHVI